MQNLSQRQLICTPLHALSPNETLLLLGRLLVYSGKDSIKTSAEAKTDDGSEMKTARGTAQRNKCCFSLSGNKSSGL
ncbi:hypothetical protein PBY51_009024 [Eleginops maclovinus]|nr:hypothetical protein PBY51_009024 [Eleginops maclovinus]